MGDLKLFMLLLGCKPGGRNTEQHDMYFGIGRELKDLVPGIIEFWPEANKKVHIDAWREVTRVDNFSITVRKKQDPDAAGQTAAKLFFINLGGYKSGEFEEFHYKMLVAAGNKGEAIDRAKETAFYKHTGFKSATSHVDDKYGIDVDDMYEIKDILSPGLSREYSILLTKQTELNDHDEVHLGYFRLDKL